MDYVIASYLFVIGAVMGSFAGAVAWRLEKGRDFVRERSECEHCHHKLSALDLIPIVSWLWLRGRCGYCRKPIGYTAILIELSLGVAFAAAYLFSPFTLDGTLGWLQLGLWLIGLVLLAILFIYDARHFLLPDVIMFPLIGVGLLLFALRTFGGGYDTGGVTFELIAGLVPVAGVYLGLYWLSQGRWVGFGDVKLGVFIGLALGWQGALIALILANLLGTLWIAPGLLSGRLKRTDHIPFGPFLILATIIAFLWAETLWRAYMALFIL